MCENDEVQPKKLGKMVSFPAYCSGFLSLFKEIFPTRILFQFQSFRNPCTFADCNCCDHTFQVSERIVLRQWKIDIHSDLSFITVRFCAWIAKS